jgi:hypothetical protein
MSLPPSVPATEFSEYFIELMRNRMAVSYFKYGMVAEAVKRVDMIASLKTRLQKYLETGNTEWLVDVGNIAMIEFMAPQHPHAHFRATSADESPGRVTFSGRSSQKGNDEL